MPVTPLVLKLRKQRQLPKAESPPPEIPRLDLGPLMASSENMSDKHKNKGKSVAYPLA
jgi:hypothetical protein